MKKVYSFLFGLLLMLACRKDSEPITSKSLQKDHIKYFGFTLIDTYWDDPTDTDTRTNYSEEVAPFSNVADILVVSPTDDIVDRMKRMQQLQMRSILHVAELLFERAGSNAPSGNDYMLRADYQERWDTFVGTNLLAQNQSLIEAFYLGEEPTWNGISASELQMAADYIKATVSGLPIMVIEASTAISDIVIPTSVDWVGFDHYFVKDPKNDSTFKAELELLKSKLSVNQRLVLVMDTHYIEHLHGDIGGIAMGEMGAVAKSYYELAQAEPKTIAILCYFWPNGFDDVNARGARNMPDAVKSEYIRIGKEITGK